MYPQDDSCRKCGLHGGDCWPKCPNKECYYCGEYWNTEVQGEDCPYCEEVDHE